MDKEKTNKIGFLSKLDLLYLKRGKKVIEGGRSKQEEVYGKHPSTYEMSNWFTSLSDNERELLLKTYLNPYLRWWFMKSYSLKSKFGLYLALFLLIPVLPIFILYIINDMNDAWALENMLGGYGIPLAFLLTILAYYLHYYAERADKAELVVYDPISIRMLRIIFTNEKRSNQDS